MATSDNKKKNTPQPYTGFTKFRKEWLEPIVIAVVVVFFIKTFIVQNFKIPSSSMEDTLLIGDRLFASKFIYGAQIPFTDIRILKVRDPKPGDVIVFKYPADPSKDYIKRCIAVEGQTVEIRDKQVFVDGELIENPPESKFVDPYIYSASSAPRDNMPLTVVPEDCLFAMGDNRDNSADSRYWGFVPYENLKGKAIFIYWSIDPDEPFYNIFKKFRWGRILNIIR